MTRIFLLVLLLFPIGISGQVVNTEKLRADRHDRSWWGEADASFRMARNADFGILRSTPTWYITMWAIFSPICYRSRIFELILKLPSMFS